MLLEVQYVSFISNIIVDGENNPAQKEVVQG